MVKLLLASALAATLTLASAQSTYPNQTAGFHLKLSSADSSIDNSYLVPCHSGAAINQLCLSTTASDYATYYLNFSDWSSVGSFEAGVLTWNQPYNDGTDVPKYASAPLNAFYSATSNVVSLAVIPSELTLLSVGIDGEGKLFVPSYIDETVAPPTGNGEAKLNYNWHVCQTNFSGYRYTALTWVTYGAPINPSCVAVSVKKEDL